MIFKNLVSSLSIAFGSVLTYLLFCYVNKNNQKEKFEKLQTQKNEIHNILKELDLSNHPNIGEEAEKYNNQLYELKEQDATLEMIEKYLGDGKQLLTHLRKVENDLQNQSTTLGDAIMYLLHLKIKAPKEITHIFNNFPCHLKSQYLFKVAIIDNDEFRSQHSQNVLVHTFKREDFNDARPYLKNCKLDLGALSRQNHCSLEFRPPEYNTEFQQLNQNVWSLYLVVNGRLGVQIKRENKIFNIKKGHEAKIQEKDEIILLPQLSYVVQNLQQNYY